MSDLKANQIMQMSSLAGVLEALKAVEARIPELKKETENALAKLEESHD